MAPVKRTYDDALFSVDSFDFDESLFASNPKKLRETTDNGPAFDLTTFLISDSTLDAVVPSVQGIADDLISSSHNPWLGTTTQDISGSASPPFHELPGDFSDSDGDFSSLFSSPAHVLSSEWEDPFLDDSQQIQPNLITSSTINPTQTLNVSAAVTRKQPKIEVARSTSLIKANNDKRSAQQLVSQSVSVAKSGAQHHDPMQAQPPVNSVRWAHNSTERKRRLEIRRLFSGLRDLFPDMIGDDKISNINTLNRAIDCVSQLNKQSHDMETQLKLMRQKNSQMKARLAQTRAQKPQLAGN